MSPCSAQPSDPAARPCRCRFCRPQALGNKPSETAPAAADTAAPAVAVAPAVPPTEATPAAAEEATPAEVIAPAVPTTTEAKPAEAAATTQA